jgi:hypothetical protein
MKPYVINKNSWHYKMISKGQYWDGYLSLSPPKDFCSYWRMVMGKLLTYAFFITMGTIFAVFLGYNIYLDPIPVIGGLFSAISILFIAGFIAVALEKAKERRRKHDYDVKFEEKPESLLKMKYRAWKEKTCPMVEYE